MIRLYEIANPANYKDFENYVFTNLSPVYFDFPNDTVTLDGTDYRLSTIDAIDNGFVAVTYSILTDLISNSLLNARNKYAITDYKTKYAQPVTGILMEGETEEILVKPSSSDTLQPIAYSSSHPNHIIYYDIDKKSIVGSTYREGLWENGANGKDPDLIISSVTVTSFIVNSVLCAVDDFNLYVEDSVNWYDLYASDLGTSFTITDLGNGTSRIDLLVNINLTDATYNYIWVYGNEQIATRKGYITYRKDTERNFSKGYDFLNVKFRRYLIDSVAMAWNSGTTYVKGDHVSYNNNLYISIKDANLNQLPTLITHWNLVFGNASDKYLLTGTGSNYAYSKQINHDVYSFKDFYCYSAIDESTGDVTFNHAVNNISDEHIYYLDNNVHVKQSTNNHDFYNNSFIGSSQENTFYYQSVNNNTFQSSSNNIFFDGLASYNFFNFSGSNEIVNLNTSRLNYYVSFNYIRFTQNVDFQGTFINNIVNQLENSKFGVQSDSNIITSYFYQNDIGSYFRNNVISDVFYGNNIGRNFYDNTISSDFYHNQISGEFYLNRIEKLKFYNNNIIGKYYSNVLSHPSEMYFFRNNLITGDFYSNTLQNYSFQRNIINGDFYNNSCFQVAYCVFDSDFFGNTFNANISRIFCYSAFANNIIQEISSSIFYGTFSGNTLTSVTSRLIVYPDIGGINFSTATIIYGNYFKEIVSNNAGVIRISYLDASFIKQFVNLTT